MATTLNCRTSSLTIFSMCNRRSLAQAFFRFVSYSSRCCCFFINCRFCSTHSISNLVLGNFHVVSSSNRSVYGLSLSPTLFAALSEWIRPKQNLLLNLEFENKRKTQKNVLELIRVIEDAVRRMARAHTPVQCFVLEFN